MDLLLGLIGAALACAVLTVLALVVLDRWTARSTWNREG